MRPRTSQITRVERQFEFITPRRNRLVDVRWQSDGMSLYRTDSPIPSGVFHKIKLHSFGINNLWLNFARPYLFMHISGGAGLVDLPTCPMFTNMNVLSVSPILIADIKMLQLSIVINLSSQLCRWAFGCWMTFTQSTSLGLRHLQILFPQRFQPKALCSLLSF